MDRTEKTPLLGEHSQETITNSAETVAHNLESSGEHSRHLCSCLSVNLLNAFLALLTVSTLAFRTVSLPAYTSAVTNAGSDPFSVALIAAFWFQFFFILVAVTYKIFIDSSMNLLPTTKWRLLVMLGLCYGIAGIPLVFASEPSRTPPYLQALLSTVQIPYTVVFRYLILKKVVGVSRLICSLLVVCGFVISLVPQLKGDEQQLSEICTFHNTSLNVTENVLLGPDCISVEPTPLWYRLMWPLIYMLGFIPVTIMFVLIEMELKKYEVRSFTFLLWLHIFAFATLLLLFWTDLIPEFGMAVSLEQFSEKLITGIQCHFSVEPQCQYVVVTSAMYVIGNCSNLLFQSLLTRYGEGSTYPVVISAIATPLTALFWTIFTLDPFFVWSPTFNVTTIYILAGLAIMIPAVVLYNVFSIREEERKRISRLSEAQKA